MAGKALEQLRFDNVTLRRLPVEGHVGPEQRQVRDACFSRVELTPLQGPSLVALSGDALQLLDLDAAKLQADHAEAAQFLSGSKLIPGAEPAAHCYCGHQFGSFAGQLGDGAAMYLGEVINNAGERWELQFKGAGKTPYSRTADGRKVLRSSLREFLCSEAMHYLGVPTTRAASLATSRDRVMRDMYYDGNPTYEPCAVVSRIAPTFIRFGSFEICKKPDGMSGREGPSHRNTAVLQTLLDFVREQFFGNASVVDMFKEMVRSTAYLVSRWQGVGWCHGVLNTDNMSVLGLTIDYGPYGFMEHFDPDYICNGSDNSGRYTYATQAAICRWNLKKFIENMALLDPALEAPLTEALGAYDSTYDRYLYNLMGQKLGLALPHEGDGLPAPVSPEVREAVDGFFTAMEKTYADFTGAFRALCEMGDAAALVARIVPRCASPAQVAGLQEVKTRNMTLQVPPGRLKQLMLVPEVRAAVLAEPTADENPQIDLIRGEYQKLEKLSAVMESIKKHSSMPPCEKRAVDEQVWASWAAKYTQLPKVPNAQHVMSSVNPVFILRQWVLQELITAAEGGDFAPLQAVLERSKTPFVDVPDVDAKYTNTPEWASSLVVTCSS